VLEYLHAQNPPVIFRDLKPSNIMVTRTGYLYLIDFGIARLFKPGQAYDTVSLGSAGYAAPEQYGKSQTTIRSDIFSFGVVLYQLLTGVDPAVRPFTFPAIRSLNSQVPPQLESLVLWMIQLDESRRPADIAMVHRELNQITSQFDSTQPVVLLPVYQPSGLSLSMGTVEQRSVPATYASAPVVKRRGGRCALIFAILAGLLATVCLGALACSTAGTVLQRVAHSASTVDAQNTQSAIQHAVGSDVTSLMTDETTLHSAAASLEQDSSNLDSVLMYYAQDWKQMQKDYQQELLDYQKGCGSLDKNVGVVLADENSVKSELVSIHSDDSTFTKTEDSFTTDLQQVQKDIRAIQVDLQTLKHDAHGSYGGDTVTTSESDAQTVLASAQQLVTTVNQELISAQSQVKKYDQAAAETYMKAQNLDNSLHC
jgi:Protein kinase domain